MFSQMTLPNADRALIDYASSRLRFLEDLWILHCIQMLCC